MVPVLLFPFFSFFGSDGVSTQSSVLVRQAVNSLSHVTSPFCYGHFGDRVAFCLGQAESDPFIFAYHHSCNDRHMPPCPATS
jgi:hypothetical protein